MTNFFMRRPLAARLLLSASAAAIASTASAQETSALETDTIIVTGIGPDRAAAELIGNATALDREVIVENLSGTLGDTLDNQPGVATTFFGQGASRPVLRGLGAERVLVLTNSMGVLDVSAASPDHQVTADGIDAEKIEILRGPAALAYGGQAIGGVVNVLDGLIAEEAPEEPVSGELYGAYNGVNEGTELAGKAEFAVGQFVLNLSASLRDFDSYEIPGFAESDAQIAAEEAEEEDHDDDHEEEGEAFGTLENSFLETQTYAAGLSWVGEAGFFGVAVRQQTAEYGLPGHGHEHEEDEGGMGMEPEEEEEEENAFIDLEQTRIDIRGGVSVDYGFITDITGGIVIADYEHIEFEAPGEPGTTFTTEGYEGRIEVDHEIAGFQGAFGVQYLDKEFAADGDEAFVTPTDTLSYGVFLYEFKEWDSGFGVEGGLRFDDVELDNINQGAVDFQLFSASAGAHKHLGDGWFAGAGLAYAERAPNESELFAFGPHLATDQFEVGDATLDKETALNIEGTLRWSDDIFSVGANVFYTDFSDFIYLTPGVALIDGEVTDEGDGLDVFLFVQDDAEFFGGEVYGAVNIDEGPLGAEWEFGASVDIVEAELGGGENVPFIPPVTFNASASAEWGAFEVGASTTIAGEQDNPGVGQFPTDSFAVFNLRAEMDLSDVGIGADGTEAFVEVRNLTDEEVRYATSVLKDLVPAPGRNIRAGIRVAF